ncbi:hypothetical protein EON63_23955 [archaeon]|nr:MAG: hypothetical protein EON63_23955 [archaeon]
MSILHFVVAFGVLFSCISALKTVSILGASGYTGAELTRILLNHPGVKIQVLTGDRSAGMPFRQIFPQFSHVKDLPILTKWENAQKEIEKCDVTFCCLPHGTTQEIIKVLATNAPQMKVD